MKKTLLVIASLAALSLAAPACVMAADQPGAPAHKEADGSKVKGQITKVDGKTITVGEKSFTIDDKTEIMVGKKAGTAEDLKVGEHIVASVKDGVATRVLVQKARKAK